MSEKEVQVKQTQYTEWITDEPQVKKITACENITYNTPTGIIHQQLKPIIEGAEYDFLFSTPITVFGYETTEGELRQLQLGLKNKETNPDYPINEELAAAYLKGQAARKVVQKEPESIALMEIVDKMAEVRKEG
jgi:hypothetical protein